ncbi:MAG: helix-turn-helix domain-containing protein [Thermoguttaceae bacterium]
MKRLVSSLVVVSMAAVAVCIAVAGPSGRDDSGKLPDPPFSRSPAGGSNSPKPSDPPKFVLKTVDLGGDGFAIRVPPLRDRPGDLPLLVEHFLRESNRESSQPVGAVSPDAMRLLEAYHWPGNVRELQSVVKYAVVHAVGEVITPDCLPESCRQPAVPAAEAAATEELADLARFVRRLLPSHGGNLYRCIQQEIDRIALGEVLRHTRGNQVQASQILGMSRTTLRAKLSSLGMDDQEFDPVQAVRAN